MYKKIETFGLLFALIKRYFWNAIYCLLTAGGY